MLAAQWTPLALALLLAGGCATVPSGPVEPGSSCADTAMRQVPPGLDVDEQRCVASALVTTQCSTFDPTVAGRPARAGGECSRRGMTPMEVVDCCRAALRGGRP